MMLWRWPRPWAAGRGVQPQGRTEGQNSTSWGPERHGGASGGWITPCTWAFDALGSCRPVDPNLTSKLAWGAALLRDLPALGRGGLVV